MNLKNIILNETEAHNKVTSSHNCKTGEQVLLELHIRQWSPLGAKKGLPSGKVYTCREIKYANIIVWVIIVCTHLIKTYSLLFILHAFHYVGILINEMS